MSKIRKIPLALIATIIAGPVFAQTTFLPDIVISGNQVPQPADRVGASNTVLQGDELRSRGILTLSDALRTVPGLHVSALGAKGTLTQVRIRGAEANHIQVLIDDVPAVSPDGGAFDFGNFPIDDVERIEVLRGPQSGIYGGNAQAGVISIYTKSGRGLTKPELTARIEYGSQNTSLLSAGLRGQNGMFYGAINVSRLDTDGYNISTVGSEKDGSRAFTFNMKAGVDLSDNFNIEGVIRHSDRKVQFDSDQQGIPQLDIFAQNVSQQTNARINFNSKSLNGALTQRLGIYTRMEDFTGLCPSCPFFGQFDFAQTSVNGGDYKVSYNFAAAGVLHTATGLVDWKNEKFEKLGSPAAERQRTGLAYEHIVTFAMGLSISGSIRHDLHDGFQDFTSYRIAASQKFNSGTRLHTSFGTGITLPTFYEQFGFGLTLIGNPNLKPETSKGWDIGVEQTFFNGMFVADITYFSIDATNAIGSSGPTVFNQTGVSERRGIELTGKYNPLTWLSLQASYTYLDADTPDGIEEVRRPRHSGTFAATFIAPDNKTRASVTVVHNGRMRDNDFQAVFPFATIPVFLTDYTLVNAIVTYQLNPNTQLYVRGENLLNEQYQEVFGYRSPGATGYVGARIRY